MDDCTAVIMAAGPGSRMTDLTNQCPKVLLPIGRYPMIWYPIRSLEKSGFSEIIIITRKSYEKQLHNVLGDKSVPIEAKLDYVAIPDNEDEGTAESLRRIADKIKATALVVSCDFLSDCNLSDLIRVHRKHNSSFTSILSHIPSTLVADTAVPGFKSKQKNQLSEKMSIGFDSENDERIIFWRAQIDMDEDEINLTKRFLDRFPCTRIQSKWTDMHVYMINKFVLKYLVDKSNITSLQGELLPLVVKKQTSILVNPKPADECDMSGVEPGCKEEKDKDLIDFAVEFDDDITYRANFLSLTSQNFGVTSDCPRKDLIKCYAYRQTDGFCMRTNTMAAYFEACKQIPRLLTSFLPKKSSVLRVPESTSIKSKSQIGADCLLGENVEIGEKVSVKKSVIGKNCKIEDKVKITNSVIMDNVIIQESSNISNCIIADGARIGNKCELTSCILGQKQNISTMSKHQNEALTSVDEMMEVALE